MEIRTVSKSTLVDALRPHYQRFAIAILFGGDRLSCCDEVFVALEGEELLGAVTLAPKGEQMSGQPTIVALWVHPEWRRQGIARALLVRAIERMAERDLTPVRIDALSSKMSVLVNQLPEPLRQQVRLIETDLPVDSLLDL